MHLDHTTIRTTQLDATRRFFEQVFGLTTGQRPAVIAKAIPGYWLYTNNQPIVHLIGTSRFRQVENGYNAEAIDHSAFSMDVPYHQFLKKLEQLNIRYSTMDLPDINERRIFLHTPTGILLESVFRGQYL